MQFGTMGPKRQIAQTQTQTKQNKTYSEWGHKGQETCGRVAWEACTHSPKVLRDVQLLSVSWATRSRRSECHPIGNVSSGQIQCSFPSSSFLMVKFQIQIHQQHHNLGLVLFKVHLAGVELRSLSFFFWSPFGFRFDSNWVGLDLIWFGVGFWFVGFGCVNKRKT